MADAGTSAETVEPATRQLTTSISSPSPSALRDDMPPKKLPLASKSLGLRLVGTVVAQNAERNLAIIEHESSRKQKIYHEGDSAGPVRIKRIERNEVIIDAGKGDQRLTMLHGQASGSLSGPQPAVIGQFTPQKSVKSQPSSARYQTFRLDREEVASALKDVDQVMQQVRLSPYKVYNRASGLKITNIRAGSIFAKMGLRSRDVIKAVNYKKITGTEQTAELFQTLVQGGDVIIRVKGTRRGRLIHLKIE
jgi:type II secretion system protein C